MLSALADLIGQHRMMAIIWLAFIALGTVYSLITPLFEASDEIWHYPFVKHLADGKGLPVSDPQVREPWRQEGCQPPLYYALGALTTFWIDTRDLPDLLRYNPHADIGVLTADGNINMVTHSAWEGFPYRGTALAVHLVRLLSVGMGAGTVLLTYAIALEIFPQHKGLATGAAAFNAFIPMFLFISGSVNNDNLVVVLCSLALLLLIRLVARHSGEFRLRRYLILLGVIVGLAALSKASALGLLPLTALALAFVAYGQRSALVFLKGNALVWGAAGCLAGWWYVRNWALYGDPLGLNVFVAIVGARHPQPSLLQLLNEWEGFTMSFWGLFGGLNVPTDPFVYRVLNALALLGAVGLLIFFVKRWRKRRKGQALPLHDGVQLRRGRAGVQLQPNEGRSTDLWDAASGFKFLLLLSWPLIIFVALIRWTTITKASQGRLMFPAISAIATLFVTGLSQWVPKRYQGVWIGLISVAMFAIAALVPFRSIAPAYARPASLSAAEIEGIPHRLDVTFDDKMQLLGYAVEKKAVTPGESLSVTVYWRSLAQMDRDYSVFVHLLGDNDLMLAQRDTYPGLGAYATRLWRVGEAISDTYTLMLPTTTFAPDSAQFEVGLYHFASEERLLAYGPMGEPLGDSVRFHEIAIVPRAGGTVPNPSRFDFEGQIALIGYDLDKRAAWPGETIHLTLYWQALTDVKEDYTVFTHILGEGDRLWAQKDSPPQGGVAPTSAWREGQVFADEYDLVIQPDTPPDVYEVEVGLYSARTGERLTVRGEEGHSLADRVLLSKVRVVGS